MALTYNPSTWEVKTRGSGAQGQPQLPIESEASLGYLRPCLKDKMKKGNKKTGEGFVWRA